MEKRNALNFPYLYEAVYKFSGVPVNKSNASSLMRIVRSLCRSNSASPALVIIGLGNPGEEYIHTRHNVGFKCVEKIAQIHKISFSDRRQLALIGQGNIEGHSVVIAKPRTFMNNSGQAVKYLLARYRVPPEKLLVIYDDVDLSLGKVRLRKKGGSGGHNGIKSIKNSINSADFPRLRIGIGHPSDESGLVEYVLSPISEDEKKAMNHAIDISTQTLVSILAEGIDVAMSKFN